jgi:hypothetical protein
MDIRPLLVITDVIIVIDTFHIAAGIKDWNSLPLLQT